MITIQALRNTPTATIFIGSHPAIIQSILDFDFLGGKISPTVKGIIGSRKKFERYFFGKKEILLPVFPTVGHIPHALASEITYFFNTTSGRRVLQSSLTSIAALPHLVGGAIFAEDVPEQHALALIDEMAKKDLFLIGPASVGLLIPKTIKLGAIGGVDNRQLIDSKVFTAGDVAVFSSSGGMTNELMRIVAQSGHHLSFALSFGGDRFPILSPREAFLAAENDAQTKRIVYFGELGGVDEYELIQLLEEKKITKPIICYIGGVVAELFETPPQFGHAKAMAKSDLETARAKRQALSRAGVQVGESFSDFVQAIKNVPVLNKIEDRDYTILMNDMRDRKHALITTSLSYDQEGEVKILGQDLLEFTSSRSFAGIVSSMFLGKPTISQELEEFVDTVLRLLVDHGPYVSGAVNTIVTARAGRDLVSALSAGLLTIGPRFGGAINQAASNWIKGVESGATAHDFVEEFAQRKEYISGIGHRKYRSDFPDPRVKTLFKSLNTLSQKRFSTFAQSVEAITVAKKGNLILNVDGVIAAALLDILSEKEGISDEGLKKLAETEFFNGLFVLSRSVGLISHFIDQKRLDEGLLRLDEDMVSHIE